MQLSERLSSCSARVGSCPAGTALRTARRWVRVEAQGQMHQGGGSVLPRRNGSVRACVRACVLSRASVSPALLSREAVALQLQFGEQGQRQHRAALEALDAVVAEVELRQRDAAGAGRCVSVGRRCGACQLSTPGAGRGFEGFHSPAQALDARDLVGVEPQHLQLGAAL
jgi:hypothetical protein